MSECTRPTLREERAKLALEELKRTGAFDRSILIVAVPTGSGMIDPAALDTVEYLHRGDIATVAMQYSYLASWLSLLVEPDYGAEAGKALFREVYAYWSSLPREGRPKLYLHGLSLGAMNSELAADLYDVVADPFQGALWSGPPFPSRTWRSVTDGRNPGSPEWLPRFRDSSIFRFTNQNDALDIPDARWGPMRIVYLQYASDPITFFDVATLYREPDWMKEPRGPDVSRGGSLVSAHHDAPADGRHGDGDDLSDGLRPCLRAAALHRRVDGRDRSARHYP